MNAPVNPSLKGSPVKLTGALDLYSADATRQTILEGLEREPALMLDLSEVTRCDLAGLQLICAARKSAGALGKAFATTAVSEAVTSAAASLGFSDSKPFSL